MVRKGMQAVCALVAGAMLVPWPNPAAARSAARRPAAAHEIEVRAVRLWASPDSTRLVLDLSGRAAHNVQVLRAPDRVVLDVEGARLARNVDRSPAAQGSVRQVRISQKPSGGLHLVLNLSRPAQAKSFLSAPNKRYGYRLVVDLTQGPSVEVPVKVEHAPAGARDLIVAVDAGHGGDDPGAIGLNGAREKDVVLAIARELALKINAEPGMRAVLTRNGDYFVPLRDRMRRARAQQADLFVSVHADSIRDRRVDGSSVYILSQRGASDEAARWLAERENASDLVGGVSLDDKSDVLASVLLDVSQSASLSASGIAAERVLRQLNRVGEVRKPRVQEARFMVLKSPDIPSMLVETAYISNPQEEQRLRSQAHQAKIAGAIHQGVHDYFYANPPAGTRIAQIATAEAMRTAAANGPGDAGL
ncbi:MAG TPA: N-acetylmuramoyl-L-alanine amidase [Steroidobacteraceae bacterium]|nr:N-acetylmuramoyl-L-alanine amidase [Steroidobacteraceae bacterium]